MRERIKGTRGRRENAREGTPNVLASP